MIPFLFIDFLTFTLDLHTKLRKKLHKKTMKQTKCMRSNRIMQIQCYKTTTKT